MDNQGTPLAAGFIGSFNVAIPDTTAPTASLTTAPTITTPLSTPYQFTVTYADNIAVSAASVGNGNLTVTGPGNYSQNATLVSTGLADGPTVIATYSVPAPTIAGTYTVSANASQVTDISANTLAAGSIGTFVNAPAVSSISGTVVSALNSAPIAGRRVFLDANGNGVFDSGETAATTDSNGAFTFTGLAAGTYRVTDDIPAGASLGTPNLVPDVIALASGQAATGIVFSEVPAPLASGPDLTATLIGKLPSTVVTGSKGTIKVKVVNNGSAFAGPLTIALQTSDDGSLGPANASITTFTTSSMTLKPGASKTMTINFTFSDSLTTGSKALVAVVDPTNAIAESNEMNNTASTPITIVAASRDLTGAFAKVPAALVHGKKGTITLAVSNPGSTAVTGPFTIRVFESADQTLDGSDVVLGTMTTPKNTSIAGGKSKNIRVTWTTPPAVVFGNQFILAQVDSTNVVAESNENNNLATATTTTSFS